MLDTPNILVFGFTLFSLYSISKCTVRLAAFGEASKLHSYTTMEESLSFSRLALWILDA